MKKKVLINQPHNYKPFRKHKGDCYDLYATKRTIHKNGIIEYETETRIQVAEEYDNSFWQTKLYPRSSIHKTGLILSNSIGIGDFGYTGTYKAKFYHIPSIIVDHLPKFLQWLINPFKLFKPYEVGDRILQFEITKLHDIQLEYVDLDGIDQRDRGENGYGSTDK